LIEEKGFIYLKSAYKGADMSRESLYEAIGGADALLKLAHAWHRRCLDDPIANHPFSHPGIHPQHTERLAAYLGEALGGPRTYTEEMGDETHVRRLHAGNGVHDELDERCVELFVLALHDVGIADECRQQLADYFRRATRTLALYPDREDQVPNGLRLPQWSWDGPVE
jgi:hemoglobin